jgi:hypothetical protein
MLTNLPVVYALAIVVTAMRTGLNADPRFGEVAACEFSRLPAANARHPTLRFLGRGEITDRNAVTVRIPERELPGLSVRIHMWLLFKPIDEGACSLKRKVEIIDTEEQQEAVAG